MECICQLYYNNNNSELVQGTFIITIHTVKLQHHTLCLFISSVAADITAAYEATIIVLSAKN